VSVRTFLAVAGVIAVLYAIGFLVVPEWVLAIYGISAEATVILGFRFFGEALLALGIVTLLVRKSTDAAVLRALLIGLAIGNSVGVLVALWGTLSGVMNAMGWSGVAIYAALVGGYVYYLLNEQEWRHKIEAAR
jgi:hypothetical protein